MYLLDIQPEFEALLRMHLLMQHSRRSLLTSQSLSISCFKAGNTCVQFPGTHAYSYCAGKQLAVSPAHIHFGNVQVGVPAHRTARLLNCSTDVVRFTVVRPELPLRWVMCFVAVYLHLDRQLAPLLLCCCSSVARHHTVMEVYLI